MGSPGSFRARWGGCREDMQAVPLGHEAQAALAVVVQAQIDAAIEDAAV